MHVFSPGTNFTVKLELINVGNAPVYDVAVDDPWPAEYFTYEPEAEKVSNVEACGIDVTPRCIHLTHASTAAYVFLLFDLCCSARPHTDLHFPFPIFTTN